MRPGRGEKVVGRREGWRGGGDTAGREKGRVVGRRRGGVGGGGPRRARDGSEAGWRAEHLGARAGGKRGMRWGAGVLVGLRAGRGRALKGTWQSWRVSVRAGQAF